jgi:hypothetical protein
MKPVHICVPVLKRYDLLRGMLLSLNESQIEPKAVYVLDNGQNPNAIQDATDCCSFPIVVWIPERPMGVAESWNRFIQNVPEERLIVNDDILFAPDSIERLVETSADLAWAEGCGFSCFLIRDNCIKKLGLFDETISPGYGYYEDEDYLQRLDGRGTRPPSANAVEVPCGIVHLKSKTLEASTPDEMKEHHRKFWIAQTNYINKWSLQREFHR